MTRTHQEILKAIRARLPSWKIDAFSKTINGGLILLASPPKAVGWYPPQMDLFKSRFFHESKRSIVSRNGFGSSDS
jgi:hypothetical protein